MGFNIIYVKKCDRFFNERRKKCNKQIQTICLIYKTRFFLQYFYSIIIDNYFFLHIGSLMLVVHLYTPAHRTS